MDKGEDTALTLLDLSAAFDTIDHAALIIDFQIGLEYLGRYTIGFLLICKLGTNPYKLKTLCQIKSHSHIEFHIVLCWDQSFSPYTPYHSALLSPVLAWTSIFMLMILKCTCLYEKSQRCVMAVSAWMAGSKLKLNTSETIFFSLDTKLQREKFLNYFPCLILGHATNPSVAAKHFGVVFDNSLISVFQASTYSVAWLDATFVHIIG